MKEIIAANNRTASRQGDTEVVRQGLPKDDAGREVTEITVCYYFFSQTCSSRPGQLSSTPGAQSTVGEEGVFIRSLAGSEN